MQRLRVLILVTLMAACGRANQQTSGDSGKGSPAAPSGAPSAQDSAVANASTIPPAGEAGTVPDRPPDRMYLGKVFPPQTVQVLMPGAATITSLDLADYLGKRPIAICYFVLGESIGEGVFQSVQKMALDELKGKIDVFATVRPGRKMSLAEAAEKLKALGVKIPTFIDEDFKLGSALGVNATPTISFIDAKGVLRIPEAKSLKQIIGGQSTMRDVLLWAADGGAVASYGRLRRYYPANELIGEHFLDFTLKEFKGERRIKFSDVAGKPNKLTGLLFWHPNCPHCKVAMPGIVVSYATYKQKLDIISVVDIKNEEEAVNTDDTIRAHGIKFTVLEDEGKKVADMYKIVSTPTFLFIRPDGVVDSVYVSGETNYLPVFQARIKAVLGAPGKPPSAPAGSSTAP